MVFAMKELGGLESVLTQPGKEAVTSELVETILDEAAKFASNVLASINAGATLGLPLEQRHGDHHRRFQASLRRLLRDRLERMSEGIYFAITTLGCAMPSSEQLKHHASRAAGR